MKYGMNKYRLLLLAILFIGLFFRIYNLSERSIWLDEGFSIRFAHFALPQILTIPENHPPLYYLILHWWMKLFGDSEFSIRFLSVIFDFLAMFMIYKIGIRIFGDRRDVGLLSAVLLGLSTFHIAYSQDARSYTLSTLLTLLSMYFFIKLLEERSYGVLMSYVLFSVLLMYSHIYGLFIIAAQNIYVVTLSLLSKGTYQLTFRRWILIQIILIVLFALWLPTLISRTLTEQSTFWAPKPSIAAVIDVFSKYSGAMISYQSNSPLLYQSSLLLLLFLLVLSSLSIIGLEKTNGRIDWRNFFTSLDGYSWRARLLNTDKIYFLLVWLLTPIILPFIISQFSTPIFILRYTIVASLAFYLLIAKGISSISHKYAKSIIIGIIIVFSLVYIREYYTKPFYLEQWRDVANYVDTNAKNKDLLLFHQGDCQDMLFDYYSKRTDVIKKSFPPEIGWKSQIDEGDIKKLGPTVEGYNRVWVILAHHNVDTEGLITKTLMESYHLSYHQRYTGITVYLFEEKE